MKKKLIVAALVAAVAAALVAGPSLLAKGKTSAGKSGAAGGPGGFGAKGSNAAAAPSAVSVRTAEAVKTTLQSYIEVNGDVVAETKVDVVPDAAGKLVSLKVEVGSEVRKGQLIAEVDPSKPGAAYSLSPVYAPISGTVTAAPLSVGATVSTATTVATVGVMDKLEIEAKIPERDVGQLKAGLRAQVSLEAFPGELFAASVSRVAPVVDSSSRSKAVVLKFQRDDPRINAGMFAHVKLSTVAYADRVAVPDGALTTIKGATSVYVVKGDAVELRAVKTGVSVDGLTEIAEGVAAGETVVTEGQQLLSDGAAVRVVAASRSAS